MGNYSIKNSQITILKPHTLHIIGRNCTKLQANPMKSVGGVAERDLSARRPDGITHTRTDEGHFYSPPSPTSGDRNDWDKYFVTMKK